MHDPNENRPGYKKTKVGWIPVEWECAKFGSICSRLVAGVSVNSGERPALHESELGVLKTSCVGGGRFIPSENKIVDPKDINRLSTPVSSGSVIISRMNTPNLVGANAYVGADFPNLFLPDRLWLAKPKNTKRDAPVWFGYVLGSSRSRYEFSAMATGTSSSMKNIAKGDVFNLCIARPPKPEQQKIAKILTTWDNAIDRLRKLIEAKKRQKKGLMQQLLTGKRRLPGFEGEWIYPRAGELFDRVSEKNNKPLPILSVTQDNGVVLRSEVGKDIAFDEKNVATYKVVRPGDFIISLRSFQGGLELSTLLGKVSPAYHVIRGSEQKTYADFYRHYFKSYEFINRLDIAVIGIRDGKQVSFDDFAFLKTPNPSLEEQTAIAKVLDAADREIRILESKLDALESQKKGLMQRLLTGQIRVNV